MDNGNGWGKFIAQAALTASLAGLAAFVGAQQRITKLEEHQTSADKDLARVEAKLDRLAERISSEREESWRSRYDTDLRSRRR